MYRKIAALSILLSSFVFFLAHPPKVLGCSCAPERTAAQNMQISAHVFSGKVLRIESYVTPGRERNLVTFDVYNVWKGNLSKTFQITTQPNSLACGFDFEIGEEYLIFTWVPENELPSTSSCSGNILLKDASLDITELGQGVSLLDSNDKRNPSSMRETILVAVILLIVITFGLVLRRAAKHKKD